MKELIELQAEIERVRDRLHRLVADRRGSFLDPAVAELSRALDDLIVRHDQLKAAQQCKEEKTE
ncbi:MAG: aspartyl-phosphate phosphatase Spo0E family protein [Negativicutes bacterium]|nr:aspartyl-phosphate phosphatase Spo0E family protein [Negativicutes bacterium]